MINLHFRSSSDLFALYMDLEVVDVLEFTRDCLNTHTL